MADFHFSGIKLTAAGQKYVNELKKLQKMVVEVGFQGDEGSYDNGVDIVTVAAFNEFGTSRMPARPFMQQSWENHEKELNELCGNAYKTVLAGGSAEKCCDIAGAGGVGIVQKEIDEGGFAPNAPSTVARKGSSHPLIDTGLMRQSVHYQVKGG